VHEIWLLMYFENVDNRLGKNQIYNKLGYHLSKEYKKSDKGIIRQIIQKGNVEDAIKNAEELHNKYINKSDLIFKDVKKMNFYELIEQFMLEIS